MNPAPPYLEQVSSAVRMIAAIENATPFPHWLSFSLNLSGEVSATCVVRGTFLIAGAKVARSTHQEPIRLADVYYGQPGKSSLRLASDLAPFKPRAEILFRDPIAKSPRFSASAEWPVEVSVGSLDYRLFVTGQSRWQKALFGYRELPVRTCRRVPILYELAACADGGNPLGCDCSFNSTQLPRVRTTREIRESNGRPSFFAGLGPVPGAWPCRAKFAGTYDECWTKERWPLMPSDFNYEFYNVSHPSLRYSGYFTGSESVQISGMTPEEPIRFCLPAMASPVLLMHASKSANRYYATFNLDTIEIDVNCMLLSLVWRSAFEPPAESVRGTLVAEPPEDIYYAA